MELLDGGRLEILGGKKIRDLFPPPDSARGPELDEVLGEISEQKSAFAANGGFKQRLLVAKEKSSDFVVAGHCRELIPLGTVDPSHPLVRPRRTKGWGTRSVFENRRSLVSPLVRHVGLGVASVYSRASADLRSTGLPRAFRPM